MGRSSPHRTYRSLGYKSYTEYLSSPHWRRLRREFIESRDQACYCCGEAEGLQLHHRTYERIGAELLDDLVWLCARCHELVHVLERRGDIGLDLAGLLDAERAKRYAVEQPRFQGDTHDRDDALRREAARERRRQNREERKRKPAGRHYPVPRS